MQQTWSSFKITLFLYIIVLILPLGFYFVHTSFKTIRIDTQTVRNVDWLGGAIVHISINPSDKANKILISQIDNTLHNISEWVTQNNDSELYIGATTLFEDFSTIESCWKNYKQDLSQHNIETIKKHALHCYKLSDDLAIIIEKMVQLKQNKIINIFYLSLFVTMILLLLIIYFIRTYIKIQMKKHAIHDHETKLFNKKYFLSELKTSCARSARHNYPLTMLSIDINNFGTKDYDKKTKEHILKVLGGLITSLTRTSDVASRYDKDNISILLTDTEGKNALILEGRIREALEKHDFGVSPQLEFKFATSQFDAEEAPETFVSRTHNLLK